MGVVFIVKQPALQMKIRIKDGEVYLFSITLHLLANFLPVPLSDESSDVSPEVQATDDQMKPTGFECCWVYMCSCFRTFQF